MTPFLFGDSAAPLFGVFHPSAGAPRERGVLICPSIGHEYMRCHWLLRRVAEDLAAAGWPVLRFDYFGTGDAAGASGQGGPHRWEADIRTAAAELRQTAGVAALALVGIRLGASLALGAANGVPGVRTVVLCDPVVRGARFLEQLVVMQRERDRAFTGRRPAGDDNEQGLLGYAYPPSLRAELAAIDLLTVALPPEPCFRLLTSGVTPDLAALRERLHSERGATVCSALDESGRWTEEACSRRALLAPTMPATIREALAGSKP